jgi:hypothetical protein
MTANLSSFLRFKYTGKGNDEQVHGRQSAGALGCTRNADAGGSWKTHACAVQSLQAVLMVTQPRQAGSRARGRRLSAAAPLVLVRRRTCAALRRPQGPAVSRPAAAAAARRWTGASARAWTRSRSGLARGRGTEADRGMGKDMGHAG